MDHLFNRTNLAAEMARRLLRPGVLDEGFRSGLFLSGQRRIGKSTFIVNDLIPALKAEGAVVIYLDAGSDFAINPAIFVHAAVKNALQAVPPKDPGLAERLTCTSVENGDVSMLESGLIIDPAGTQNGFTIAQALASLVEQSSSSVVLIVDELQHAINTVDGNHMLHALKAARDAINLRSDTHGYFLFVGAGSPPALMTKLTTRSDQPFLGANTVSFPNLGADYVDHLLKHLRPQQLERLPTRDVAIATFDTLGNRPDELVAVIRQLQHIPAGIDSDDMLPVLAEALRTTAQ